MQGGDEADAVALDLARLLAAQGNHWRRARELCEEEEVEVKVRETERTESMHLLAGIRCTVSSLPDALLWCPSAGEPQQVALECEARETVVLRRMRTRSVANAEGVFVRKWGSEGEADGIIVIPLGVAVDSEHVFVSDGGNNRVKVYSKADGAFVRQWGVEGDADGQFRIPEGVAVDTDHVYVCDNGNHRVQIFSKTDGSFVRKWGYQGQQDGQLYYPRGVAVDSDNVYVSDCRNHRIQVFSKIDGSFVRKWGTKGQGDGQFNCPNGVAVDSDHVYVCDGDNHRVQVFSKADVVRRWAAKEKSSDNSAVQLAPLRARAAFHKAVNSTSL
jgi:hypothetical protein